VSRVYHEALWWTCGRTARLTPEPQRTRGADESTRAGTDILTTIRSEAVVAVLAAFRISSVVELGAVSGNRKTRSLLLNPLAGRSSCATVVLAPSLQLEPGLEPSASRVTEDMDAWRQELMD